MQFLGYEHAFVVAGDRGNGQNRAARTPGCGGIVGYALHLRFGRFVLQETKDPAALKHAAEFTRGYRSGNTKFLADAIAKVSKRSP